MKSQRNTLRSQRRLLEDTARIEQAAGVADIVRRMQKINPSQLRPYIPVEIALN
jgi:hypothetical protein